MIGKTSSLCSRACENPPSILEGFLLWDPVQCGVNWGKSRLVREKTECNGLERGVVVAGQARRLSVEHNSYGDVAGWLGGCLSQPVLYQND